MSLLDDLNALDLSAIVDGKLEIGAAIDAESITALIDDGAITSVLGDIGVAIDVAVNSLEDPSAMVQPIVDALLAIVDEIDLGDLPIAEYVTAVTEAARVVGAVVSVFTGDPRAMSIGAALGGDAGGGSGSDDTAGAALDAVGGLFGDHAAVVSGEMARFRALVQSVEQGLPSDPAALLGPALEILVPFPTVAIDATRAWAEGLSGRLDDITIDAALTGGLVEAYAEVRVAAEAGDAAAISRALASLDTIRIATIGRLADAMRAAASAVSGLGIASAATAVHDLRGALSGADDTVFELLDGWREMIATARIMVGSLDPAAAMAAFDSILDEVETTARDVLLAGVDGSVEVVQQWLRDLLREIPIRPLRHQLSQAIAGAAEAIADADLDAPVASVREALTDVSNLLSDADPAALVGAAVDEIESVVTEMIDRIAAALSSISAAIDAVADQAVAVLERAVDGLGDFRAVVDEITAAIENAGIIDAANEIAATLEELREDVSDLLSGSAIPDALRGAVDQVVSTLEEIDLDTAIGAPLREVAAQIQIPADVATAVRDGLEAITGVVDNLVPTDIVAELEGLLGGVIAEIEALDVSEMTSGVASVLGDAAEVFDGVRIAELIAPAGDAFERVLDAVDRVHPRVVLRPAIDLHREILDAIGIPDPETMTTRVADVTSQAGEAAARAAAEPARRAVGTGATTPPAGSDTPPTREEAPSDLRPGDIVRLVGFLPAKLREAISGLDDGAAGEVIASIDRTFGGSAELLRSVSDRVIGLRGALDASLAAALTPLAAAHVDAQLALRASVVVEVDGGGSSGATFDLDASLSLLATAGPGAIERQLDGERALVAERCSQAASAVGGTLADDLDQAAGLLSDVLPGALLTDVDSFLAALDPEPIAAEFDALLVAVLDAMPGFVAAADTEIRSMEARIRGLIDMFNPGTLMQRYLRVLDVVREELALLDPGRLADELGEVHAQIRTAVAAYDPTILAADLDALLGDVAAAIRGLDPAGLLPDLTGIADQVARLSEIVPVDALAGVGTQLEAVGDELRALDLQGMLDAINALAPEIADAITILIEAVRTEIVNLLESIRYTSSNTSASASLSMEVG